MKAKILYYTCEKASYKIVRCYLESDFALAEKDLEMMQEYASYSKYWELADVDIFGLNYTKLDPLIHPPKNEALF